jgi:hypothetical protein
MMETTDESENVAKYEHMNPMGFVVGRLVIEKGKISKKYVDSLYSKLSESLNKTDIIRYARWWLMNILSS